MAHTKISTPHCGSSDRTCPDSCVSARIRYDRGGNIDKDIADKFGEKAVVFLSITAQPDDIKRMERERRTQTGQ